MSNLKSQNSYLFGNYARYPITLVKGDGAYVWDESGKKYLDFVSGIACTVLGHNYKAVNEAAIAQINKIIHTSNLYHTIPAEEFAKRLVQNGGLDKVFFCNSGTEANEAAIKLARKFHNRNGRSEKDVILSAVNSFHGRTFGSLAATGKPAIKEGFGPMLARFKHEKIDDIELFCSAIDDSVAAVIIEPIQGEGGIIPMSAEFLQAVSNKCIEKKALLIFDEVQCGIGRTGEYFAFKYFQSDPDIITMAKGAANGFPIGVVCAKEEIANAFMPGDHGTTFGGNPVSCNAAIATFDAVMEHFLPVIRSLGHYVHGKLLDLQDKHKQYIKSIRAVGFMIGIELFENPKLVLDYCHQNGLLVNITGNNVIRLLPPYVVTKEDIDEALSILSGAFENLSEEL